MAQARGPGLAPGTLRLILKGPSFVILDAIPRPSACFRVPLRMDADGTRMVRGWYADGRGWTRMARGWYADGTRMVRG